MDFFKRILGEEAATRLNLWNPPHVSENNLVVHSYIESIDGAYLRGELKNGNNHQPSDQKDQAEDKKVK